MKNNIDTPPIMTPAETMPLPALSAFEGYLAGAIQVDDLLLVEGEMYRVAARWTISTSSRITYLVSPCAGGTPRRIDYPPGQVVQAVTFDTEEQTRPMQPIRG